VVAVHSTVSTNYFLGFGTWEGAYARQLAAGVTIFFLLSGFLLYRPFVRGQLQGTHRIAVRDFTRRRLLRIVPAYWFALTILALWPGLPEHPLGHNWWRFYFFAQDASDNTLFGGLGTAWSLGTEVSFYLVLPFYALLIARLARGRSLRHRVGLDVALLLVLSVGSLLAGGALVPSEPQLGYTLVGTFDWFAIGMAVALASAVIEHTGKVPRVVRLIWRWPSLCWAGAFAALTFAAWYWERTGRYDPYRDGPLHLIWAAIALFLLLPAAFPHGARGVPSRVLSTRLLAWLGLVSYGIYLWHLPLTPKVHAGLVDLTGHQLTGPAGTLELFACVVAASAACAAVSYYLVERPLLRFKNRRALGPQVSEPTARLAPEKA
jgi:peptidoglycan/LPS O-acetylase OafA/YrhL